MSRGFRDADTTQAMSDRAVAAAIDKILHQDREQGVSAEGGDGRCSDCREEIGAERLAAIPSASVVSAARRRGSWRAGTKFASLNLRREQA